MLVRRLLKPSNNVLAEHLVKTMGRVGGKAGTWKAGSAKLRTWLKTTQSVPSTVRIVDGSGLAHSNKLTARVTVRLLQSVRKRSWFGTFYDALPVAGVSNASIGSPSSWFPVLRDRESGPETDRCARAHRDAGSETT